MERTFGKIFTNLKGLAFGVIRESEKPFPAELEETEVLAEDGCGNYFVHRNGGIYFWDHETNEIEFLAKSLDEFISGCSAPIEKELKPEQIKSAWIDPEFAKQFNIAPKP